MPLFTTQCPDYPSPTPQTGGSAILTSSLEKTSSSPSLWESIRLSSPNDSLSNSTQKSPPSAPGNRLTNSARLLRPAGHAKLLQEVFADRTVPLPPGRYCPILGYQLLSQSLIGVTDPMLMRDVLDHDQHDLESPVSGGLHGKASESALQFSKATYVRIRYNLLNALSRTELDKNQDFHKATKEASARLIDHWYNLRVEPTKPMEECLRFWCRSVLEKVFIGTKVAGLTDALENLSRRYHQSQALFPQVIPACFDKKYCQANELFEHLASQMVNSSYSFPGVIGQIITRQPQDHPLTPGEVASLLKYILVMGYDALLSALTSTVYCLASNPEQQSALRRVLEEKVSAIPKVNAFIYEVLRIFPPIPLQTRHVEEDLPVGEYTAPAGSSLRLWHHLSQRDVRRWRNPEEFDPSRFKPVNETGKIPIDKKRWLPFGDGPNACPAQDFALMALQAFICHLLPSIQFNLEEDTEFDVCPVLKPRTPLKINVTPPDLSEESSLSSW